MTSILLAVCILLSVLVAVDLLLTIGIVRRLKAGASLGGGAGEPPARPRPGHRIDPRVDSVEWDEATAAAITGTGVLILAVSHCSACERLKRELAAHGRLPLPVYVMGDPVDDPAGTAEHLASWPQAAPVRAPRGYDELDSLERPTVYPVIAVLENGRVVSSGHRLSAVVAAAYEVAARIDATEHVH
jgi:hypothetical protein